MAIKNDYSYMLSHQDLLDLVDELGLRIEDVITGLAPAFIERYYQGQKLRSQHNFFVQKESSLED